MKFLISIFFVCVLAACNNSAPATKPSDADQTKNNDTIPRPDSLNADSTR